MRVFNDLFISNRFFYIMAVLILLMIFSYAQPFLLPIAQTGLIVFAVFVVADVVLIFNKRVKVAAEREAPAIFSLGDDNDVRLKVVNRCGLRLKVSIIDELPEQFQVRDFLISASLPAYQTFSHIYQLRPVTRGEYCFGDIHLYVSSPLAIVRRRITHRGSESVPVYPSILQMKKYELKTIARAAWEHGVKKVRRIGHSYEFEHIRTYAHGDDYRSINWKATGRRAQLMVNQYEDERSQQVYCIIDKSRVMHMPFNGLSLFDYAVNASLVISNIVLGKQDKAGLITFADKPATMIKASRSKMQLRIIMDALYRDGEGLVEADYEGLYTAVRRLISGRSLLFLYTNFESSYALRRVLPQLRRLNDQHLLVVVFFENTEITAARSAHAGSLEDVYAQVTAEHYTLTKVQMAQQLRQHGILTVLTKPENLTVSSINQYLELKSRGLI